MKKIRYIGLGLLLCCSAAAFSQEKGVLTLQLNYSAGIPTGSFKDVTSNNSYNGFGGALMYHFNNSFSLGLETGSQEFYQKTGRQLYKSSDGSDVSAVLSSSVQLVPVMVRAQYNFLPHGYVRPYLALATGGNVISYKQYAGEFTNDSKSKFGFAARPEAGLYIPFGKYSRAGFSLGAGYNVMPFKYNGIDNFNHVTARAGISIPLG